MSNFKEAINPFKWIEDDGQFTVCLDVGEYCDDLFKIRESEGFIGNGYDWESLALVFLEDKMPKLEDELEFDSEAGMFCVYSENKKALEKFILGFKEACEDKEVIKDLFSRAELQ